MTQYGTKSATGTALVILPGAASARPSLASSRSCVDFLSQLIAARANLAPQRARRRAGLGEALVTYRRSAETAHRRMPAGYRTTLTV